MDFNRFFYQQIIRMLFLLHACNADIKKTVLKDLPYSKDASDQG